MAIIIISYIVDLLCVLSEYLGVYLNFISDDCCT